MKRKFTVGVVVLLSIVTTVLSGIFIVRGYRNEKEAVEYLAANGIAWSALSSTETLRARKLIADFLLRLRGEGMEEDYRLYLDSFATGIQNVSVGRVYGWELVYGAQGAKSFIPDSIPDDAPMALVFEDLPNKAFRVIVADLRGKSLTEADVYAVDWPAGKWLFGASHEGFGPYFLSESTPDTESSV